MNRLKTICYLILSLTALMLMPIKGHADLSCWGYFGTDVYINSRIIVPADTPDGTLIWKQNTPSPTTYTGCTLNKIGTERIVLNGAWMNHSETHGIDVEADVWTVQGQKIRMTRTQKLPVDNRPFTCTASKCTPLTGTFRSQFYIYKNSNGEPLDWTKQPSPVGYLQTFKIINTSASNNSGQGMSVSLAGISNIVFVECGVELQQVPTVDFNVVPMQRDKMGEVAASKAFQLEFNKSCSTGNYRVGVEFTPVQGTLNTGNGLLIPTGNTSVGIRLRDGDNDAIVPYNQTYRDVLILSNGQSGHFTKPMIAELVWNSNTPHAGTFNAAVEANVIYY